jgi:hypothetical protein
MVDHGGWAVLREELQELATELCSKLREHQAVLILGELAAVASQWDTQTRQVAREFATIVRRWADALIPKIEAATPEQIAELRGRRCLFSMYTIVCHSAGELSLEDVKGLTEAVLIADYSRLFGEPTALDSEVRKLSTVSYSVLARRLPEVLRMLDSHLELLTSSVKLVLEATPDYLDWHRVTDARTGALTQSYDAVSPANDLYSVNIQTGVVLFNGLPPHRLPASMVQMPLYKQIGRAHV